MGRRVMLIVLNFCCYHTSTMDIIMSTKYRPKGPLQVLCVIGVCADFACILASGMIGCGSLIKGKAVTVSIPRYVNTR